MLIIEILGMGGTVLDLPKKKKPAGKYVIGALLTNGDPVTRTDGVWHLNKREIINSLSHSIDEGIIRIPDELPTKDQFQCEARSFYEHVHGDQQRAIKQRHGKPAR